jgi:Na+/H+ antiporter NhaB
MYSYCYVCAFFSGYAFSFLDTLFIVFCVLFVCKCVLQYCHRVSTQQKLGNISDIGYLGEKKYTSTAPSIINLLAAYLKAFKLHSVKWYDKLIINCKRSRKWS